MSAEPHGGVQLLGGFAGWALPEDGDEGEPHGEAQAAQLGGFAGWALPDDEDGDDGEDNVNVDIVEVQQTLPRGFEGWSRFILKVGDDTLQLLSEILQHERASAAQGHSLSELRHLLDSCINFGLQEARGGNVWGLAAGRTAAALD